MGSCKSLGKPNKLQGSDLQWTNIPSRGSRNTPTCGRFVLQRLAGINSGSYMQDFSQIGVQVSCGRPLSKENCFIFHMLPFKLLI